MTLEQAKEAFFSAHWGQEVFCKTPASNPWTLDYKRLGSITSHSVVLLRSIDQLTDEEAITLAKIAYGSSWEDETCIASVVPNADNIHQDILSVEIQTFINYPPLPKYYKCCHIQIDRVDPDINLYRFMNDGKQCNDDIIDSVNLWACLDYLRSIGILLPFTYLSETNTPVTLSPSRLIELGWCRIKE